LNLSVSNIAWPPEVDEEALDVLRNAGITALEVAPTRLWPHWVGASAAAAAEAARHFARRGFHVSSLQAILFGKPECRLFGSDNDRQLLFDHLTFCADLASGLGASHLVFGAPKNRELCGKSEADAFQIAREFFDQAGRYYQKQGLCLCLEPNPPQYGCQFVVDSAQGARLVQAVDSEGFRLHLDTGCMRLAGEDPVAAIRARAHLLRHFHVSEPFLGDFDRPVTDHRGATMALEEVGYSGWVTLEMRASDRPLETLTTAVGFLVENCLPVEGI
jgi:D-psicose/D-tagatose/L-ribulose 3-epimerase